MLILFVINYLNCHCVIRFKLAFVFKESLDFMVLNPKDYSRAL